MKRLKFGFRNLSAADQLRVCESTAQNLATLAPEHLAETKHEALADVVAQARASHDRVISLKNELKAAITQRDTLIRQAREHTIRSASIAALNMNNNPAQMLAIGLPLHAEKAPVGLPGGIEGLRAAPTAKEGEAALRWRRPLRDCRFEIEAQADPYSESGWKYMDVSFKQSHTLTGLTSGHKYWVRVRAANAHGRGPWSQPATVRVK